MRVKRRRRSASSTGSNSCDPRAAQFSVERIDELEKTLNHDVIAFLTNVAEHVGENSRYIHLGLTSSDIVDTALSVLIRKSGLVIRKGLLQLQEILAKRALEFKDTRK